MLFLFCYWLFVLAIIYLEIRNMASGWAAERRTVGPSRRRQRIQASVEGLRLFLNTQALRSSAFVRHDFAIGWGGYEDGQLRGGTCERGVYSGRLRARFERDARGRKRQARTAISRGD